MMCIRFFSTLAILLLVVLVGTGGAEEDEALEAAGVGTIAPLLDALRAGDDTAREAAVQALTARARFTLPYVLAAVESTQASAYRERCRAVAEALRTTLRENALPDAATYAEFPSWEEGVARSLVERRRRAAIPDGPRADLDAATRLAEAERYREAAEALLALVHADPTRLVEALEAVASPSFHRDSTCAPSLDALRKLGEEALETLPRLEKARVALALANWYTSGRENRLDAIAKEYADSPAGALAKLRRIRSGSGPILGRVASLEALASANPGTEVARKALEEVAFQYATVNLLQAIPDPLERLRRLADVAMRLQGDEFPGSEGSIAGVLRLSEFYVRSKAFSAGSTQALLDFFRLFFRQHFLLDVLDGEGATVGYYFVSKMERLHTALGVPKEKLAAAVDGELEALEEALPDKGAIRYLRAERRVATGDLAGAAMAFGAIEDEFPGTLYARKALAARAGLAYAGGDLDTATTLYDRYGERHPTGAYAWVAALRAGHSRLRAGDGTAAIHAYESADAAFPPDHPMLSILVPLALGRAYEATGQIDRAVLAYQRAVAALPAMAGSVSTAWYEPPQPSDGTVLPDAGVRREQIQQRVSALTRPGEDPEAVKRLVYGEKLRERGSVDRALKVWAGLVAEWPESPVAADAREAIASVWIQRAIKAAGRRQGKPREAAALEALAMAEAAEARFGSFTAAFVRAALALRKSEDTEAQRLLGEAVREWAATQTFGEPEAGLESDVAAIRAAAFVPDHRDYRVAESDQQGDRPHLVLSSTIEVHFPDGTSETLDLTPKLAHLPSVLYFTADQLQVLARYVDRLGAVKDRRRGPDGARLLEPGDARAIAALLGRYFPVRAAHWHGWHVGTYPILGPLHFQDAERTAATAKFRVRYRGGEVKLSRRGDTWFLAEVDYQWLE